MSGTPKISDSLQFFTRSCVHIIFFFCIARGRSNEVAAAFIKRYYSYIKYRKTEDKQICLQNTVIYKLIYDIKHSVSVTDKFDITYVNYL